MENKDNYSCCGKKMKGIDTGTYIFKEFKCSECLGVLRVEW